MRKPLIWFELSGQHSDNSRHFYEEILGWQSDPRNPATPRERKPPARPRGFFRRSAHAPSTPPWWVTFYTAVPDLEDAIRKARSLGSRVLVPPTRHGDALIAVISDPDGHPVGLCS